jgi:hypothetical protein
MRDGHYEGRSLHDPSFRWLFSASAFLQSDWYRVRLKKKQSNDTILWTRHIHYLEDFLAKSSYAREATRLGIEARLAAARERLNHVRSDKYYEELIGTIGVDWGLG